MRDVKDPAHLVPHSGGGDDVLLWLSDGSLPATTFAKHAMRLQCRKQTGAVKGHISITMELDDTHSAKYSGDVAITVTSLSATRIAGTFATGDLSNSPDTPQVKPHIRLTGGTFDVPFATSKLTPP